MIPLAKSFLTSPRIFSACLRLYSSLSSEMIENMDKKATWDRFYAEVSRKTFKNFEWFFGFETVQNFIMPVLQTMASPDARLQVLDLGCGTSALGPSVYQRCPVPVRVTCGDISPVAVRLLREHVRAEAVRPGNHSSQLDFVELDCTQLHKHFGPASVDLIVDKGTTDALLKSQEGKSSAGLVLKQCLKVLRHSGSLLQFSDEDPDARLVWLETKARSARVAVQEVGEWRGVCYYCYQVTPPPPPITTVQH
ncbi:citrate synthase-lysine N-methyltransferase CSKMT, mitochondrial-like isoform X1 [Hippocampus zosterae]|uniref:citrate synthase-lysine N-methyltransferase CSKMT, mitochondrial-like isoform X1 n=1 Tax=Hippocampus zosterae TaxID=109293 RepID=UPI00223D2301|nr:citrate synthase-lysine N-methyltransferase CSKMT, mitochondrial-like isoform X1 [Hippocampus zosterae]